MNLKISQLFLILEGNKIGLNGLAALAANEWKQLKYIDADYDKIALVNLVATNWKQEVVVNYER